jgi:hypothetical protein
MLATLLAVTQPIRGHESAGLDTFALIVPFVAIGLWIVAANYRARRSA